MTDGLCGCGCGGKTWIATCNDPKYGHIKGTPVRFVHGHWNKGKRKTIVTSDGYIRVPVPGHPRADVNSKVAEHILVAEKALGRPLPSKAVVHHWDENRSHNNNPNLLICEDDQYHKLIHARMRALKVCGHADWKPCPFCGKYDATDNMVLRNTRKPNSGYCHIQCRSDSNRRYTTRRKSRAGKLRTQTLSA